MEHINLLGFLAPICLYIRKRMSVMNVLLLILIVYIECCEKLYWFMFCILWQINFINLYRYRYKYDETWYIYYMYIICTSIQTHCTILLLWQALPFKRFRRSLPTNRCGCYSVNNQVRMEYDRDSASSWAAAMSYLPPTLPSVSINRLVVRNT